MKEKIIEILNRKINEALIKKESAKKNNDLVRMGLHQRIVEILTEIINEIKILL